MKNNKKTISIFGVTGSVGKSVQAVLENHLDDFEVNTIVAKSNFKSLIKAAKLLKPKLVLIAESCFYEDVKKSLIKYDIEVATGDKAILEASKRKVDIFVAAIMGFSGLYTTYSCIPYVKSIALANKESLVCAGSLIMEEAMNNNCKIIPIDSEHNTLFQLLDVSSHNYLKKIIITASGGPFLNFKKEDLEYVTPDKAIKHPIWKMGAKISVDSATLMNKGLELIEAAYLFNINTSKIDVLIHPQSIIHAFIEYVDGIMKAGMYNPDMKIPIAYALHYPNRKINNSNKVNLALIKNLNFQEINKSLFNSVDICRSAYRYGTSYLTALNASNEVAVYAFLNKKINFNNITVIIEKVLSNNFQTKISGISDIIEIDKRARSIADSYINKG